MTVIFHALAVQQAASLPQMRPPGVRRLLGAQDGRGGLARRPGPSVRPVLLLLPPRVSGRERREAVPIPGVECSDSYS